MRIVIIGKRDSTLDGIVKLNQDAMNFQFVRKAINELLN